MKTLSGPIKDKHYLASFDNTLVYSKEDLQQFFDEVLRSQSVRHELGRHELLTIISMAIESSK